MKPKNDSDLLVLILRQKQIEAISAPMRHAFELEMVHHLREAFPEQCETMDDDTIREIVRYGMGRAARYAFKTDGQVKRWLSLMFTFGRDFNTNPDFGWARDILTYGSSKPELKMKRLYKEALRHEHKGRGINADS